MTNNLDLLRITSLKSTETLIFIQKKRHKKLLKFKCSIDHDTKLIHQTAKPTLRDIRNELKVAE